MANYFRPQVLASLAVMALFSAVAMAAPQQGQDQNKDAQHPLPWAYAVQPPGPPPPPPTDDAEVKTIPGSNQSFTMKQLRDTGNPVDWFPGDHPPMPAIVAHRRRSRVVFRRDEFHFLEFQAEVVQRFLDQVRVLVSDVAEFGGGHTHEKDGSTGMTVLGGFQPSVVRMPVDLFFQRIQNAQPRIGGEARAWNRHK